MDNVQDGVVQYTWIDRREAALRMVEGKPVVVWGEMEFVRVYTVHQLDRMVSRECGIVFKPVENEGNWDE